MELADRVVGFLLSFISLSIFTYYTFWVIILVSILFCYFILNLSTLFVNLFDSDSSFFHGVFQPFVDSDNFIHKYFLPQEYAILIPVCAGVVLLCLLCMFVGFVMLKSKKKKA